MLERWCRKYRAGGLEAQRPKPQGQTKRREIQAQIKTDARVGTHGGGFLPEGENCVPEKGPGPTGVEVAKRKKSAIVRRLAGQGYGLGHPSK